MAFPFKSSLFTVPANENLKQCALKPLSHIQRGGSPGEHVKRIQEALGMIAANDPAFRELRDAVAKITEDEKKKGIYGKATADAVLAYKKKRAIINRTYQDAADNIVGQMTIRQLDDEVSDIEKKKPTPPPPPAPLTHQEIIQKAFDRSRETTRRALHVLRVLKLDIERAIAADGNDKILAIQQLGRVHARDIAVVSKRLFISGDPLSQEFRDNLDKVIGLVDQNLRQSSTIDDQGSTGRCAPTADGTPGAATVRDAPDPRVSVCTPFFSDNADLQRDRITHEFFHLVGLADVKGTDNTAKALNNANTIAQIVAWLVDRHRQVNSDGNEAAVPPLPEP